MPQRIAKALPFTRWNALLGEDMLPAVSYRQRNEPGLDVPSRLSPDGRVLTLRHCATRQSRHSERAEWAATGHDLMLRCAPIYALRIHAQDKSLSKRLTEEFQTATGVKPLILTENQTGLASSAFKLLIFRICFDWPEPRQSEAVLAFPPTDVPPLDSQALPGASQKPPLIEFCGAGSFVRVWGETAMGVPLVTEKSVYKRWAVPYVRLRDIEQFWAESARPLSQIVSKKPLGQIPGSELFKRESLNRRFILSPTIGGLPPERQEFARWIAAEGLIRSFDSVGNAEFTCPFHRRRHRSMYSSEGVLAKLELAEATGHISCERCSDKTTADFERALGFSPIHFRGKVQAICEN